MAKILVVDDEPDLETLIKQKFRKQIREKEFEFLFAVNGVDALNKLDSNGDVDMVLTDINMPEMDGLTLLSKINQSNPLLKSVIVSAYGDMENIRTAMNRGAFDFITKPINFEDMEITVQKTLDFALQIKQNLNALKENNILKMYVDDKVLNFMGTKEYEQSLMANETINATVAFFDICSFTTISETEPADTVVTLLNNYFDVIVKEIIDQRGYIDKFIGDAVMAVFRDDFHLDRAVEAALSVKTKIAQLPELKGKNSYRPDISIGIHSGEMITGNIGSATLKRLDFTVIGDNVNIAQRLQSAAQPGQILVSESDYNQIKEAFQCQLIGDVSLKNKSNLTKVFEVIG